MEDRYIYQEIPPNIGASGNMLGGMINTRRAIEGIVAAVAIFFIYKVVHAVLAFKAVTYTFLLLGVLIAGLFVIGINDEPVSVYLVGVINYERRRVFVTLRPPMPDLTAEKEKNNEPSKAGQGLMKLLRGNKDDQGGEE